MSQKVGEVLRSLFGQRVRKCPGWPPDVFCGAALVLRMTGVYTRAVQISPQGQQTLSPFDSDWPANCETIGALWRKTLGETANPRPPPQVAKLWSVVQNAVDLPLVDVEDHPEVVSALMSLVAISDEASEGMGISQEELNLQFPEIALRVQGALHKSKLQSLCEAIPPSAARVLPKQHTPQRGITLRSLTHHLALLPDTDVSAYWCPPFSVEPDVRAELEYLNILVLPWPLEVRRPDFDVISARDRLPSMGKGHAFFSLARRDEPAAFRQYMQSALAASRQYTKHVDMIVLPELALTIETLPVAREVAIAERAMLLAGLAVEDGQRASPGVVGPANVALFNLAGVLGPPQKSGFSEFMQRKHHRWCLDPPQIAQYGLQGRLPPVKDYWELIDVEPREVFFVTIDRWLTVAALVCEDLARQDPVSPVVRSVGPNLLVALLMDGPQLRERWGAQFGGVLADDPGCSVLTVSSLGLMRLSKPREPGKPAKDRTVALWRDVQSGATEIELEPGHGAALLHVVCQSREEWTLDGRSDGHAAHFPILRGFHSLQVG